MGRWKPDAVGRLSRAALNLFEQRGFEETTVAEIAAAAGLTESTFFRHFVDKREVLFGGFSFLEEQVARLIQAAPTEAHPAEALQEAMVWLCAQFQVEPDLVGQRLMVIGASPELTARELVKHAGLASRMAQALTERGLPVLDAQLLAETAMLTMRLTLREWLKTPTRGIGELYLEQLRTLNRNLTAVEAAAEDGGIDLKKRTGLQGSSQCGSELLLCAE